MTERNGKLHTILSKVYRNVKPGVGFLPEKYTVAAVGC
ncbi:hypothetical protein BOSE62_71351 [Bosea sp. 62]|nr:hypothetical protein BOSE21B_90276 [Bosea sp. 21B]CAD5295297.1 hypothetical protein BOSE46_80373 [Bosea sp. 46]CAD5298502.1 hypothetical protein BOSE7B_60389 [Bosea sp. 7B]VVT60923.1 hypothetical protein BOS5A_230200 [Bosea sp. EC-HK365B]VXB36408.1 hypothetical protein BOSE127_110388 [Bosea sp. 127]VXB57557.1 hypothetical protein BOSE125_131120 [Bosea sp. 125]VXC76221.1 hypothetical protein BOSE29B_80263 [Bosea sp. 29B]VXC90444.1 hypothetical protein BOSE62_71351 [Bosea sp. 62]